MAFRHSLAAWPSVACNIPLHCSCASSGTKSSHCSFRLYGERRTAQQQGKWENTVAETRIKVQVVNFPDFLSHRRAAARWGTTIRCASAPRGLSHLRAVHALHAQIMHIHVEDTNVCNETITGAPLGSTRSSFYGPSSSHAWASYDGPIHARTIPP